MSSLRAVSASVINMPAFCRICDKKLARFLTQTISDFPIVTARRLQQPRLVAENSGTADYGVRARKNRIGKVLAWVSTNLNSPLASATRFVATGVQVMKGFKFGVASIA